jgi:hypothetical protein
MLAQNLKTSIELKITDAQRSALIKTLVLLETGKLEYTPVELQNEEGRYYHRPYALSYSEPSFDGGFNMGVWSVVYEDCGTVACIGGTAELIGNVTFENYLVESNDELRELFYPFDSLRTSPVEYENITPAQAAHALRNYLTNGKANWGEVLGVEDVRIWMLKIRGLLGQIV